MSEDSPEQPVINFAEKLKLFDDHWSPRVIAEMNDYQFKLAKLKGEFVWHQHDHTDETFMVISGCLTIELRDASIKLEAGEMYVVPKGVEHKPVALEEVEVLLIEPRGVVNTGDAEDDLTASNLKAENDVWI